MSDRVTRIKSATDSLGIEDTMGIDTVFFLNKNMMVIIYSPRGGSNDGFENTLILSVSNGKFCIGMEVMSQHVYGGGGPEGFYDLKLKLTGRAMADLKLPVDVHEVDLSTYKGARHYNRHRRFVLKYDPHRHVFYSGIRHIDGLVTFGDNNTFSAKLERLNGDYPMIVMGKYEYYFIDRIWYQAGKDRATGMYTFGAYCEPLVTNLYPQDR